MAHSNEPTFVKILETRSLTDIALIKSTLEGEGIRYFLNGEEMHHIRPLDPVLLMVAQNDAEKAIGLLSPLKLAFVHFNREPAR